MTDFSLYKGYSEQFIGTGKKVPLPKLAAAQQKDLAPVKGKKDNLADYINYSVAVSATRRLPYFAASNIDGKLFKKAKRKDNWRKDERLDPKHQWGNELYSAKKSDFDRGHMTKREDVQWGPDEKAATTAADSTFFFTNSVPQHGKLNQKIWRLLEDYILHSETKDMGLRVCVFTGPVLSSKDPQFVTKVDGQTVQIPTLFWKVVVFPKSDGKLYRAGFMMSQESLLQKNKIVKPLRDLTLEALGDEDKLFADFEQADTYQTSISIIEELTGMKMPKATDIYKDKRPVKLVLQEVDVTLESASPLAQQLGYVIGGLSL